MGFTKYVQILCQIALNEYLHLCNVTLIAYNTRTWLTLDVLISVLSVVFFK